MAALNANPASIHVHYAPEVRVSAGAMSQLCVAVHITEGCSRACENVRKVQEASDYEPGCLVKCLRSRSARVVNSIQ